MTTWICMLYRIISYYIRIVFFFTQDKKPSSFFSYYSFHNQLFGVIQRWYFWYGFLTKMMRFFGWPRQSQSLYIKRNFHKFQSIQKNFFCVTKYGDFFFIFTKTVKVHYKKAIYERSLDAGTHFCYTFYHQYSMHNNSPSA